MRNLLIIAGLAGCVIATSSFATGVDDSAERVKELARAYVSAQFTFDQAAIARLTLPNFVEVSPKGEVDERKAVVGFYDPANRVTAPSFEVVDQKVRIARDVAVVTQTVTMGTPPQVRNMTQSLTALRTGQTWKLLASQSTPVPAARGH